MGKRFLAKNICKKMLNYINNHAHAHSEREVRHRYTLTEIVPRERLAKISAAEDMDLEELSNTVDGSQNLPVGKILRNIMAKLNMFIPNGNVCTHS